MNPRSNEMKQEFLASAIADIATYIQLADTKVSIIMGSLVALIAGALSCHKPIFQAFFNVRPGSWLKNCIVILIPICLISLIAVFVFGILTIREHVSNIGYKSKWFLSRSSKEYPFDTYKKELLDMTDNEIIENMGAELYKLNDINRQKSKTMKWVIRSFAISLASAAVMGLLFLINVL
jgi:hypothetical protein